MMDEDNFWALIAVMNGEADEAGCHRLYLALRRLDAAAIVAFQERLSEVLFRLDLRSLAKQRWRDVGESRLILRPRFISADGFLYARCAAVATGRETVEAILLDHRKFRRAWDLGAESLLYVAEEAYEGTAGRTWPEDHIAQFDYETGSNPEGGWNRAGFPPGNPQ